MLGEASLNARVRWVLPTAAAAACALAVAAQSPAPAKAQFGPLSVRVDAVREVPLLQTVPVIGRLVALREGLVSARINGPVETFLVEVGDRVEEGQVVAAVNPASLVARRDLYASRVGEARAKLALKAAELALARQEYKRMEGLRASAAFNLARHEDAEQTVAMAEAEVNEAESAISSAKADLLMAEINVYNAEIRASYAGVVTERLTEIGTYLQVGDPVLRMIGDQTLEVEAEVPFQHLAGLRPGTEVRIALDDGTRHSAVARAVVPSENPLTRTRTVRFVPDIGDVTRPLAHEQSVTLEIPIGAAHPVLSVHKDAIIKRRGQDLVYVAKDGEAQVRPVQLGKAVGSRFEVRSGLKAGEQVVVRGNERLKPGDKIQVLGDS